MMTPVGPAKVGKKTKPGNAGNAGLASSSRA